VGKRRTSRWDHRRGTDPDFVIPLVQELRQRCPAEKREDFAKWVFGLSSALAVQDEVRVDARAVDGPEEREARLWLLRLASDRPARRALESALTLIWLFEIGLCPETRESQIPDRVLCALPDLHPKTVLRFLQSGARAWSRGWARFSHQPREDDRPVAAASKILSEARSSGRATTGDEALAADAITLALEHASKRIRVFGRGPRLDSPSTLPQANRYLNVAAAAAMRVRYDRVLPVDPSFARNSLVWLLIFERLLDTPSFRGSLSLLMRRAMSDGNQFQIVDDTLVHHVERVHGSSGEAVFQNHRFECVDVASTVSHFEALMRCATPISNRAEACRWMDLVIHPRGDMEPPLEDVRSAILQTRELPLPPRGVLFLGRPCALPEAVALACLGTDEPCVLISFASSDAVLEAVREGWLDAGCVPRQDLYHPQEFVSCAGQSGVAVVRRSDSHHWIPVSVGHADAGSKLTVADASEPTPWKRLEQFSTHVKMAVVCILIDRNRALKAPTKEAAQQLGAQPSKLSKFLSEHRSNPLMNHTEILARLPVAPPSELQTFIGGEWDEEAVKAGLERVRRSARGKRSSKLTRRD